MVALGWICNYGSALEDGNGEIGSRWVCKSFFGVWILSLLNKVAEGVRRIRRRIIMCVGYEVKWYQTIHFKRTTLCN